MSSAELGIIGKQFCFVYFLFKGSVLGPLLFGTLHHWRTLSRWQSSILVVVPSFLFNNHLYADDTTFRLPSGCDSSVRLLTLRMHYNIFSWITSFHTTEFDSQIVYNWIFSHWPRKTHTTVHLSLCSDSGYIKIKTRICLRSFSFFLILLLLSLLLLLLYCTLI